MPLHYVASAQVHHPLPFRRGLKNLLACRVWLWLGSHRVQSWAAQHWWHQCVCVCMLHKAAAQTASSELLHMSCWLCPHVVTAPCCHLPHKPALHMCMQAKLKKPTLHIDLVTPEPSDHEMEEAAASSPAGAKPAISPSSRVSACHQLRIGQLLASAEQHSHSSFFLHLRLPTAPQMLALHVCEPFTAPGG